MSDWIGTGTIMSTGFVKNDETAYGVYKAILRVHKVMKSPDIFFPEHMVFYYEGPAYERNGNTFRSSWRTCPPMPYIEVGDKAKVYLRKTSVSGIGDVYFIGGDASFFMTVKDLDKLPEVFPQEDNGTPPTKRPWEKIWRTILDDRRTIDILELRSSL